MADLALLLCEAPMRALFILMRISFYVFYARAYFTFAGIYLLVHLHPCRVSFLSTIGDISKTSKNLISYSREVNATVGAFSTK